MRLASAFDRESIQNSQNTAGPLDPDLEALSDEIEEPFEVMPNDLALDAMSAAIEATLRETLGEPPLPPAPEPVDYVLT